MTDRPPEIDQFTSQRAALVAALESTPHLPRDRAIIALALRYADLIDDAVDRSGEAEEEDQAREFGRMVAVIGKIGPRLEATLDRLGMSPGARPPTRAGDPHGPADPRAAALAGLVAGHATPGGDPAAFVDPAVTDADAGD